ncbi:YjbH domain-containing protein [Dyella silvatica]|uniref:YjbH domain-containing protein n=1 Tax=Dyella silvatica TaxID=2992128 RepID=UPI00224D8400|nr:YjbH domain-containing protein [Dyella silvatica]
MIGAPGGLIERWIVARSPSWRLRRRMVVPIGMLLAASISGALRAQDAPRYTDDDFGGIGLLQMPSARMADEGELTFNTSRVYPYTRYNVTLQPLKWVEVTFRYSDISNELYGSLALSGHQSLKSKSIDMKFRLWDETRYWPSVSVGGRDIAGPGRFSGEYVVASKRLGPLDLSLGLGWGNVGGRGNLGNPLAFVSSRFNTRPGNTNTLGGEFNVFNYFRGPTALFGGVEYQTPLDWLRLKLEVDGNNYQHEAGKKNLEQRTPVNVGALFRINHNVDFTLGYERGTTVMASLSLHANLAQHKAPVKTMDPQPEPLHMQTSAAPAPVAAASTPQPQPPQPKPPEQVDWAELSRTLYSNAGIAVHSIGRRGSDLIIHGEQQRYFYPAKAMGRTARILDNRLDDSFDWFTIASESYGLPMTEYTLHRPRFVELLDQRIDTAAFKRSIEQDAPSTQPEQTLYTTTPKKFDAGVAVGYKQSLGGPNAFVLYQLTADGNASYHFTPNLWWDGQLSVNLLNNYNKFTYTAPSLLPRVRTNVREYLTSSDVVMPNFQLTGTHQLGPSLYSMAYAGMLETMYAGVGGEVLYRPFGERWALGMDVNWVRQRGFRQNFALRNYHIVVGQASLYMNTGIQDITLALSAGRYLAGDVGVTVDFSRGFANGTKIGAYMTLTNKSGQATGEGSFDKGIYVSIPFDLLLPRSSRNTATFMWQPLLRDGGARLNRRYNLYDMTSDRDTDLFDKNMDKVIE